MKDEIMAEVWRTRDALSKKYGHDLDRIVAAMRERERQPLTKVGRKRPSKSDSQPGGPS